MRHSWKNLFFLQKKLFHKIAKEKALEGVIEYHQIDRKSNIPTLLFPFAKTRKHRKVFLGIESKSRKAFNLSSRVENFCAFVNQLLRAGLFLAVRGSYFFFSFFYTVSPLEPFFKFHFPVKSGGWMYQLANRATMAVRTNCLGWFLAATFKLEVPRGVLLVVFVPGTRVICKKFTFSRETSPLLHRNCFRSMFDF